ncbi:MAG: GAF domain-containing protein, partial [Coriobacteriia bacterium]|nr:GAF domain-containing protein [Coriobacteriia bacterium]
MMRPNFLGKHLYSQIVVPLVLASLVVGLLATVVAVYFLSNLTDQWVDQVAESVTRNLETGFAARAQTMKGIAKLASENRRLKTALSEGNMTEARGVIVQSNVALGFDDVMLLDSAGRVVVNSGLADIMPGDMPLGEQRAYAAIAMSHPTFLRIGDRLTLTVLQPVVAGARGEETYTLAVSEIIDQTFLESLGGGIGEVVVFYDGETREVARTIVPPRASSAEEYRALQDALDEPVPALTTALQAAQPGRPGKARLKTGEGNYRVWAQRIELQDNPFPSNYGYLVSVVSQEVSDQAGQTTTNLITTWSVFAVLALVGLGGWVARRVSDPLANLAEGARRIADGDFSTRIRVSGTNEVSALAESFNQMTDALRERSESLTKKVLELATLYEMSRALGATLEMDVLLDSVLDSALRIFNLDIGYVTIRDRNSGQLAIRAWRGPSTFEPDEEALRSSMSEWVIREGRPLIFNPTGDQSRGDQVDHVSGALAALCVPLTSAEGPIGAIIVGSNDSEFRFNSDDVRLLSTIANHVTIAIGNIELFSSLQEAYLSTVRSLAAAVDAKDPHTRGHSDRVAMYAGLIGDELGLSHEQRVALEMAAYLHDIGKIGVQEAILLKPGRLTDDEMS